MVRKYFHENGGQLAVRVESLSDATEAADGNLTIFDNSVAAATGTVTLRATLPNTGQLFWPNEPVRARIVLTTLKNAVLIPAEAVQLSQQGPFVFVVKPADKPGAPPTAEQRLIKSGQTQEDGRVVITDGLKAGEIVVVRAPFIMQEGFPLAIATLDGKDTAPAPGK
jgi:multidrug efflux system membrane fusion protein